MSARALAAQLRAELLLASRRGEALLVTFAVPPVLLLFFAAVPLVTTPGQSAIASLLPGIVALAVIAAAMVSLGIGTAYERHYGVLKRLGALPGVPLTVVVAKALAVLVVEIAQLVVLLVVALLLGWTPAGDPLAIAAVLVLGTGAFAGIGLFLAGTLRAEITLAVTNALFLVFLLFGGIVVPAEQLPGPLGAMAPWLPAGAFADALRDAFAGRGLHFSSALVGAWAAVALTVASLTFRVEE